MRSQDRTGPSSIGENKLGPSFHIVQGAASAAALYPVVGEAAIPFGLAVVMIDLDHLIVYLLDTGDWTLRGFFMYYRFLMRNLHTGYIGLYLFHTVEFYLLCLLLATWQPVFYPIVAGCLFHHAFDMANLVRLGHHASRSLTITHYLLRRKGHVVSIRDVLAHAAVRLEGIPDIRAWAERWGAALPSASDRRS